MTNYIVDDLRKRRTKKQTVSTQPTPSSLYTCSFTHGRTPDGKFYRASFTIGADQYKHLQSLLSGDARTHWIVEEAVKRHIVSSKPRYVKEVNIVKK